MAEKIKNLQSITFIILLSATLPIAVFGGLALAFICAGAALVALIYPAGLRVNKLLKSEFRIIIAAFLILFLWSLTSLGWTLNERAAFSVWIKVFLLISASGFLLYFASNSFSENKKALLGKWLGYSFIAALFLAFFEYITDGLILRSIEAYILGNKDYIPKISNMNRGACYFSLIFWVVAAHLYDRKKNLAILLGIMTLIVLTRLASLSAVMGFITGILVFIFIKKTYIKKFDLWLTCGILLVTIIFPIANLYTNPAAIAEMHILPLSSVHRLYIWQFSMGKIMEKPLRGWGFDSAPFIPGGNDFIIGRSQDYWRYLPLHTHNNIIQLWLELGGLGPLLLVAIFAGILFAIRKSTINKTSKAAFAALIMAYFAIGMTGFGIWQLWWLGSGFLSSAALLAVNYDSASSARASRQNSSIESSSGRL